MSASYAWDVVKSTLGLSLDEFRPLRRAKRAFDPFCPDLRTHSSKSLLSPCDANMSSLSSPFFVPHPLELTRQLRIKGASKKGLRTTQMKVAGSKGRVMSCNTPWIEFAQGLVLARAAGMSPAHG